MKHCTTFSREVLNILNNYCNPFVLNELYLDGCEGVNDQCFECLMLSKEEVLLEKENTKLSTKAYNEGEHLFAEVTDNLSTLN